MGLPFLDRVGGSTRVGVYCAARKGDDSINQKIKGGCHGERPRAQRHSRAAAIDDAARRRIVG
jgi:hypothetical protein